MSDADEAGMVDDVSATNNNGAAANIAMTAAGTITTIGDGHDTVVPATTVAPKINFEADLVTLDSSGAPVGSKIRSGSPSSATPTADPAPFAPIGDPDAPATGTTAALLNSVIVNRNKRKAKDIVLIALEFYFVFLAADGLYTEAIIHYGIEIWSDPFFLFAISTILYVVAVSVCVMIHASRLPSNRNTSAEIEEAYEKTNNVPIFDGFMEIRISYRFGDKTFSTVVYSIFVVIVVFLSFLGVNGAEGFTYTTAILACLTLYRFTADICEYHLITRQTKEEDASNPTLTGPPLHV
jgi:hypothetical protein